MVSTKYLRNSYGTYGIYTSMVSTALLPDIYSFTTKYLWNAYGIYTSMVSTNLLPYIYGIYKFATIYLRIPMRSTTLYNNYGLYGIFQDLLMK